MRSSGERRRRRRRHRRSTEEDRTSETFASDYIEVIFIHTQVSEDDPITPNPQKSRLARRRVATTTDQDTCQHTTLQLWIFRERPLGVVLHTLAKGFEVKVNDDGDDAPLLIRRGGELQVQRVDETCVSRIFFHFRLFHGSLPSRFPGRFFSLLGFFFCTQCPHVRMTKHFVLPQAV